MERKHTAVLKFDYVIEEDKMNGYFKVTCTTKRQDEKPINTIISKELYDLTEYEELCILGEDVKKLGNLPYRLEIAGGEIRSLPA